MILLLALDTSVNVPDEKRTHATGQHDLEYVMLGSQVKCGRAFSERRNEETTMTRDH